MARNGTGTFSLLTNSWNPAVNGITATSADWQALVNDIAAAITQSISADGQTPMAGNLAMGNNRITGLANAVGVADGVPLGQVPSLLDQWAPFSGVPTFIDATSFRVVGDQTQVLQVGRRIKTTNTGGTIYSTITASVYASPNTTVTVQNNFGVLDSGLSQVSYGLISVVNSSLAGVLVGIQVLSASGTYTRTPGATSGYLRAVGGGAGGGSTTATAAGQVSVGAGGQCGADGEHYFKGNLPVSQAYTIGSGGGSGGAGTATIFGALTAPGGQSTGVSPAGAPPILIGANSSISVSSGFNIRNGRTGSGGFALAISAGSFVSGAGAASAFGPGAAPNVTGSAAGTSALNPGSGGAGASIGASSGALGGGGGAPGIILVYEYS